MAWQAREVLQRLPERRWVRVIWLPGRSRQQRRAVAALYEQAAAVPCERNAVFAGGLRGADKNSALAAAAVRRAGLPCPVTVISARWCGLDLRGPFSVARRWTPTCHRSWPADSPGQEVASDDGPVGSASGTGVTSLLAAVQARSGPTLLAKRANGPN